MTWTEGAVILGRRGAPACSGGGRSGADGERNNAQGPPGVPRNRRIKNERSRSGVDCVNDSVVLVRQARDGGSALRCCSGLGLVGEGPPAVEVSRTPKTSPVHRSRLELVLAIRASAGLRKRAPAPGKLQEVCAARHVAVFAAAATLARAPGVA